MYQMVHDDKKHWWKFKKRKKREYERSKTTDVMDSWLHKDGGLLGLHDQESTRDDVSFNGDDGGDDACNAKSVGDDFDDSKIDGGEACTDLDAIDISSSKNECNNDDGCRVAVLGGGTKIKKTFYRG